MIFPPDLILILPTAMAVDRERRKLLSESRDGVVLGPRVMTFGRLEMALAQDVLDRPVIRDLGRLLLIERLILEHPDLFGGEGAKVVRSLARRLSDLIEQIRFAGLTPDEIQALGRGIVPEPRWSDLMAILRSYQQALDLDQLMDRADLRRAVIQGLGEGSRFSVLSSVKKILVRDFSRWTPFQTELIVGLAKNIQVEIGFYCPDWALEIDPDQVMDPVFGDTLSFLGRLEAEGARGARIETFWESPPEGRPPALAWLGRLFHPEIEDSQAPDPAESILVLAAPGRYAEIEEIGRRIRDLLDLGVEPDRMAVVVPDLSVYGDLIEDVFRRYRLPLFFRRGASLAIQAPVRALFALLDLASSHWSREDLLNLFASPYLDLGLRMPWTRIAELSAEAGVTDERSGGGWIRNLERLARSDAQIDPEEINHLVQRVSWLKEVVLPLSRAQTWRDFRVQVASVFEALNLKARISQGRGVSLHRDMMALEELRSCLDELVAAARQAGRADEKTRPEDLNRGLAQALRERTIGRSGEDGAGIAVLNAFDLMGLFPDYLFLAGFNEGEFPRSRPEGGLIDDAQALALNRAAGRRIFSTLTAERRQDEVLFHHALASVRTRLTLVYARLDERGRIRLPSSLLDEVLGLWPPGALQVMELPQRVQPLLDRALTEQELFGGLAESLTSGHPLTGLGQAVLAEVRTKSDLAERWTSIQRRGDMERRRSLGHPGPFSGLIGSGPLADWLGSLKNHDGFPLISPTFFEAFGRCPFFFWAERVLGLGAPPESLDEISPLGEGDLLHQILQEFMVVCQKSGMLPLSGQDREVRILDETAERILDRAQGNLPTGRTVLWQVKRKQLLRGLHQWLEQEQTRDDGFVPEYFEWSFGPSAPKIDRQAPPFKIALNEGKGLVFQGRVDRIDVSGDSVRVMDYKNSANRTRYRALLKQENLGVSSFQMPIYQMAAAAHFQKPAIGAWVLIKDFGSDLVTAKLKTDSEFFAPSQGPDQEGFSDRLDYAWTRITRGDFRPEPDPGICGFCPLNTGCRSGQGQNGLED